MRLIQKVHEATGCRYPVKDKDIREKGKSDLDFLPIGSTKGLTLLFFLLSKWSFDDVNYF